ncbi:hypothetical protein EYF80_044429 [Liparis tanakae]|uniref:Uncharacterized protein n=1 Tax=Liparis tanakae TaxID=230148 RepID=A0A4Z2FVY9_9TELE|nr:hypothetical protein EYF80_044429 [Liparis tanakae]
MTRAILLASRPPSSRNPGLGPGCGSHTDEGLWLGSAWVKCPHQAVSGLSAVGDRISPLIGCSTSKQLVALGPLALPITMGGGAAGVEGDLCSPHATEVAGAEGSSAPL